jgi:hypothetical protein
VKFIAHVSSWGIEEYRENVVADMLQYLKFIPNYAVDLMALLLGPKRFLAAGSAVTPENLTKALLFFLISSVIALIVRSYAIESPTDFTTLLLRSALAWGASLLVTAAIAAASWAIVRRPVRNTGRACDPGLHCRDCAYHIKRGHRSGNKSAGDQPA